MTPFRYKGFPFFFVVALLFDFQPSLAQQTPSHWLIGRWEGEIERYRGQEGSGRRLRVNGVGPDGDAQATWAITGEFSFPADVRVEGLQVKIVTIAKSLVELTREKDDSLVGTFTLQNGRAFPIRLSKIKSSTEIDQVTQPSFKEGDFWRYRVSLRFAPNFTNTAELQGDFEISVSGGQLKLFRLVEGQKSEVQPFIDEGPVNLHFSAAEFLSLIDKKQPVWEYLQFPLFVGKSWSTDYRTLFDSVVTMYTLNMTAETRVTEVAKIRTPAGVFRAFKLERGVNKFHAFTTVRGESARFVFAYTYFYSPETRSIVRYQSRSMGVARTVVLTEFGSAR